MTDQVVPPDRRIEDRESSAPRQSFAQRPDVDSTDLARAIVDRARQYAARKGSSFASTHSLLAAIFHLAKSDPTSPNAAVWLWHTLRPHHAALEEAVATLYPESGPLPAGPHFAADMTSDLAAVLDDAQRMALQHGPKHVAARHLVGALLKPPAEQPTNATSMLQRAGVDVPVCRTAFFHALQSWGQDDDPEAWWRFLSPAPPERALSGYMSDLVAGDDMIGITREVEAMASLVAAWSVEPPLSIGLFGEWGSGKTFFMQKMKERVRQIAREARATTQGQREFGYYKNIVQVEFNAWHYVEGNLWASLVEHIFQNLRVLGDTEAEEDEERTQAEARQQKLFSEIHTQQLRKHDAEARQASLQEEQKSKAQEALELTRQQRDAEERAKAARAAALATAEEKRQVAVRDVVAEVYGSPAVKAELLGLLRPLGIGDPQLATARDVRAALDEAVGSWTTLREGWRIVVADRGGWRLLAWVVAVPVAVGVIGWGGTLLFDRAAGLIQPILGPIATLGGLAASGVAAWKRYTPRLQPLFATVEGLRSKRKELDQRVVAATKARDESVGALEIEAEARRGEAAEKTLEAQQKGVEAGRAAEQAQEAQRQIDELRRQLDEMRPERMIASFIQERASAEDYRKHLGVPALIRRDFERLSRMFRNQRVAEAAGRDGFDADGNPLPQRNDPAVVNRIVLYVDDLDRCPPHRVVEVLRAIHLLLAFPLFVVVVAVDARWVRRSLLDRFALMLSRPAAPPSNAEQGAGNGRPRDPELPGEGATPDDYLEKIFQIAFWLRPLGPKSSATLVQNLTRSDEPPTTMKPPATSDGPSGGEPHQSSAEAGQSGTATPKNETTPPGTHAVAGQRFEWTPVTSQPRTLRITPTERTYMTELASLIGRSPRAVKRFLNSYRLIKSMLQPWELATFVGEAPDGADGTFHPTMLLLAAVTGAPELGRILCSSLRQDPAADLDTWLGRLTANGWLGGHRDWPPLHSLLQSLPDDDPNGRIHALWRAAERVDRFAFTPSRLPEREDASAATPPRPARRRRSTARGTPHSA